MLPRFTFAGFAFVVFDLAAFVLEPFDWFGAVVGGGEGGAFGDGGESSQPGMAQIGRAPLLAEPPLLLLYHTPSAQPATPWQW